ncbi:MAG: hypothetical protein ACYS5V_07390, partial [Planctomycetota bacterium]
MAALPALSLGQDAQSDQAQKLLKQGVAEYRALKYGDAKATLLKVDRDKLTDAQRKELDTHLRQVDDAIKKQAAAQEAYDAGAEALKANDLDKAAKLFDQAAASGHLPAPVRKDARAQRALVVEKIKATKAAKAAGGAKPAPADKPEGLKVVTETTTTKPAPAAVEDKRLKELQNRFDRAVALTLKGDEALAKGEVEAAVKCYDEATATFRAYEPARSKLVKARGMLVQASSPGVQAITRLEKRRRILKQETEVHYAQALRRSRESLQVVKGLQDFKRAAEEVKYAQTLLVTRKGLFTDTEYRAKRAETDRLLDFIASERKD